MALSRRVIQQRDLYPADEDEEEANREVYEKPQLALILQEIGQLKDKYGLLEQINEKLNDLFVQLKLKNSIEERKHELQDLMNKHFYKLFVTAKFVDALSPKSSTSQHSILLEFRKVIPEITEATVAEMATANWVLTSVHEMFSRNRSEFTFGISRAIGSLYGIKFLKKKRLTLWTENWMDEFMSRDQLKETLKKTALRDLATNILNRMLEDPKDRLRFWPDIHPTCSDLAFVFLKMRWFVEGHSRQIGEDDMVELLTKWKAAATDRFRPQPQLATSPSSSSHSSPSPSPSSSSLAFRPSPSSLRASTSASPSSSAHRVWEDRMKELTAMWHRQNKESFSLQAYEALKAEFVDLHQEVPDVPEMEFLVMDIEERIKLIDEKIKPQKKDVLPSAIPKPRKRRAISDDASDDSDKDVQSTKDEGSTKNAKPALTRKPTQSRGRGRRTK